MRLGKSGWIFGLGLAVLAFVILNLEIQEVGNARLDLTEERLFTLSDGTESVLKSLQKPVRLEFYFSSSLGKEIPSYALFATRVRDMLDEFKAVAGDNLIVETFDPEPFSEIEDQAVEAGMQGVPLDQSGDEVYFGLVGFASDEREGGSAIPFFQGERGNFLEYDLTKLIFRVANPEKPVVGILTGKTVFGDPMAQFRGGNGDPWVIVTQMQDFFDARFIYDAKTLLEDDPDILLIINPADFEPDLAYAIDQFMLRGGRAAIFNDPWNESAANAQQRGPGGGDPVESSFQPFFDTWGVRVAAGTAIGDRAVAQTVNAGTGGNVIAAPYVVWMKPGEAQLNKQDAILSSIANLLVPTAGSIELTEGSPLTMQPLISSTADATEVPIEMLATPDPLALLQDYQPTGKTYVIAARLSGNVITSFPDGPPEPEAVEAPTVEDEAANTEPDVAAEPEAPPEPLPFLPHLAKSEAPLTVVLVADADMLEDRFWVRVQDFFGQRVIVPQADNGAFLINVLDNLQGSEALLSLRSRGTGNRPFDAIENLRKQAEVEYRSEERALRQRLQETEQKLAELETGGDGVIEDADVRAAEAEKFTGELLETRRKLREVNLSLRRDIEALQSRVQLLSIGVMPVLVLVFALGLGIYRSRRRDSARTV